MPCLQVYPSPHLHHNNEYNILLPGFSQEPENSSIIPVLTKLHWLEVNYKIMYTMFLLVYKCLNCLAPDYLCKLLHTTSRNTRLSCDKTRLQPCNTRLCTIGDRVFSAIVPKLWNQLNLCVRETESN